MKLWFRCVMAALLGAWVLAIGARSPGLDVHEGKTEVRWEAYGEAAFQRARIKKAAIHLLAHRLLVPQG